MSKLHTYRTVDVTVFREPNSNAWFYSFPLDWIVYHSNRGYSTYSDAREAAENHVDKVLD